MLSEVYICSMLLDIKIGSLIPTTTEAIAVLWREGAFSLLASPGAECMITERKQIFEVLATLNDIGCVQ